MTRSGWKRSTAVGLAMTAVGVAACSERSPSGPDDAQIPPEPVTVSLQLPWSEFGSNMSVIGGYGFTEQVGNPIIARSFGGMEARTLLRFPDLPLLVNVFDTAGNVQTLDTVNYLDAYVVTRFDRESSSPTGPVTVALSQMHEDWNVGTANWTHSLFHVDSMVPWSVPGGGNATQIATWDWDPTLSDSAMLFLDSATIDLWKGDVPDSIRSARIDMLTDGERVDLFFAALRLVMNTKLRPDTIIEITLPATDFTFIYDPPAAPPADGMRVGGAPAWRTVLDVVPPTALNGPPELCAAVGCPFTLGPQHITFAGLGLRTRRAELAYSPFDSMTFEVRTVLSRAALPKSPLGNALGGIAGTRIAPELFMTDGNAVDVPITTFVQAYLAGPDQTGRQPPNTIAIMSSPEPQSFGFASFFGPGSAFEPVLKLIVTVSPPMEFR